MAIKVKQFRPPGVYISDIRRYTGYANVKSACSKAGIHLWKLNNKEYAPLTLQETYKVLRVIRGLQGERFLKKVQSVAKGKG